MYQNENCLYQSKYGELHIEYLYTVETNVTFFVFVRSYGFTGEYNFCIHHEQIRDSILSLKLLDNSFEGLCNLADIDSNAYICLEFENKELKVYGQLGGDYEENYMKFGFLADQTLVKLLMDKLSEALNNN